ncbi:ABC transporter ATP-binding protein [Microvirga brassicacearum]|uniref:ABC transporter ATP-binding protein n=1 Tax=Microvirga brassicacearum TaxID=2580413 RepID=A0A5N3PJ79_9HYPH|nr:ABC transporter ATP-binding protein [Microvirga brassicacearum]KAB0269786.1 ABC transporter ATP-binding protein [Microvirga brassicacearum]
MAYLDVRNLSVSFPTARGYARVVEGLDLTLDEGEILGIVGESGSGKSVSALAILGLLPPDSRVTADVMRFGTHDLLALSTRARRRVVGQDMSIIFQDPMASLNPCFTVGWQIDETLRIGRMRGRGRRRDRVIELLQQVGIPAPEKRLSAYPHQLSGGMNQRVMIAMAIARNPRLLIADEPTTALDVTVQKQILDLLSKLQRDTGMSLILISHDLGVLARTAHRVMVMYAGEGVEEAETRALFTSPQHPYTRALLDALPEHAGAHRRLPTIPGLVPPLGARPESCIFGDRCRLVAPICREGRPAFESHGPHRRVRCHFPAHRLDLREEAHLVHAR